MGFYDAEVLADSPSLFWPSLTTTTALDASGNGRNGTVQGSPASTAASPVTEPGGDTDTALVLDGLNDYVSSSYAPFVNGTVRTIEGWYWRTGTTLDALFGNTGAAANSAALSIVNGSTNVQFWAFGLGSTVSWASAWPGSDQWVHWALVFDESTNTAELFINGVSKGTRTQSDPYNASVGNIAFGVYGGAGLQAPAAGRAAKPAVYESALSAIRIAAHYAARNFVPDLTPPNTTITAGPDDPTDQPAATFTFSADEAATFQARLDGGAWATVTSPHTITGLAYGDHTWEVRATDTAGNVDATPASWSWTVALTARVPILAREKPPLRLQVEAEAPSGRRYRWGIDEPDPQNVPAGLTDSDAMPGGFEHMTCTLPRKPGVDYQDLERLSTLRILGPGADVVGEYRLERVPRVSGDRMAVSPEAVGWQAALDDDQSAAMVYVDRDLGRWQAMSRARRAALLAASLSPFDHQAAPDPTSGLPALILSHTGALSRRIVGEAVYDAGAGVLIAAVYYDYTDANLSSTWTARLYSSADADSSTEADTDRAAAPAAAYFTPATARRFVKAFLDSEGVTDATDSKVFEAQWRKLAVYGNHGLTRRGSDPGGLYASDVVAHAVRTWAPALTFTEGADGTIRPSSFVIPHLTFHDQTTSGEIVKQATRFGLQDWAVWERKRFHWHERGATGRRWRARVGPSQLEETGPQVERLFNSLVVEYRDVDGSTRTVGPTGSGADTVSTYLSDTDTENPANKLGIRRRTKLQMGITTAAGAIEVGRRFLEETKAHDSSGRARLVGHVEDDRGVLHPYWRVRSGDEISFTDAVDTSYRRIVKAARDHPSRSTAIDLDAPAQGLQATLERLGVVLVPLGVG